MPLDPAVVFEYRRVVQDEEATDSDLQDIANEVERRKEELQRLTLNLTTIPQPQEVDKRRQELQGILVLAEAFMRRLSVFDELSQAQRRRKDFLIQMVCDLQGLISHHAILHWLISDGGLKAALGEKRMPQIIKQESDSFYEAQENFNCIIKDYQSEWDSRLKAFGVGGSRDLLINSLIGQVLSKQFKIPKYNHKKMIDLCDLPRLFYHANLNIFDKLSDPVNSLVLYFVLQFCVGHREMTDADVTNVIKSFWLYHSLPVKIAKWVHVIWSIDNGRLENMYQMLVDPMLGIEEDLDLYPQILWSLHYRGQSHLVCQLLHALPPKRWTLSEAILAVASFLKLEDHEGAFFYQRQLRAFLNAAPDDVEDLETAVWKPLLCILTFLIRRKRFTSLLALPYNEDEEEIVAKYLEHDKCNQVLVCLYLRRRHLRRAIDEQNKISQGGSEDLDMLIKNFKSLLPDLGVENRPNGGSHVKKRRVQEESGLERQAHSRPDMSVFPTMGRRSNQGAVGPWGHREEGIDRQENQPSSFSSSRPFISPMRRGNPQRHYNRRSSPYSEMHPHNEDLMETD